MMRLIGLLLRSEATCAQESAVRHLYILKINFSANTDDKRVASQCCCIPADRVKIFFPTRHQIRCRILGDRRRIVIAMTIPDDWLPYSFLIQSLNCWFSILLADVRHKQVLSFKIPKFELRKKHATELRGFELLKINPRNASLKKKSEFGLLVSGFGRVFGYVF